MFQSDVTSTGGPLLELLDLGFSHGQRSILRKISLSLRSGEVVVLLGNNGAGKSTLLKLGAGILRPSTGKILLPVLNQVLQKTQVNRRAEKINLFDRSRAVAYMPQQLARPEHFPVWQFMEFGHHDSALVQTALERFDASQFLDRDCSTLSGGEWLRVQLARTFVQPAKILLLDEPSAGLDLEHVSLLVRKCRQKAEHDDVGFIISTHDLTFALAVATRVFILDEGQCVWNDDARLLSNAGVLERLFHVPVHWVTQQNDFANVKRVIPLL